MIFDNSYEEMKGITILLNSQIIDNYSQELLLIANTIVQDKKPSLKYLQTWFLAI